MKLSMQLEAEDGRARSALALDDALVDARRAGLLRARGVVAIALIFTLPGLGGAYRRLTEEAGL